MSEQKLREALQCLYDETADYIRINNLGDVHQNRSMRLARDALALSQPTSDEGTPVKRWRVTGGLMRWVGKEKEHAAIHTPWHDDPDWQSDVVFARDYDAIERTLHARERELADKDTVPRSRYNACNQDWLNAKAELKEVREIAKAEIEKLQRDLDDARSGWEAAVSNVYELERQLAALPSGYVQVPEGWKLVPEEPTEEMLKAAKAGPHGYSSYQVSSIWGWMLAATPPTDALAPQWLPIETAPKDGTTVLVGIAGLENSVGEAYWWQSEKGQGGWQTWDGSNHQRTVYVDQPTHWMPLPSPPASKAGESK